MFKQWLIDIGKLHLIILEWSTVGNQSLVQQSTWFPDRLYSISVRFLDESKIISSIFLDLYSSPVQTRWYSPRNSLTKDVTCRYAYYIQYLWLVSRTTKRTNLLLSLSEHSLFIWIKFWINIWYNDWTPNTQMLSTLRCFHRQSIDHISISIFSWNANENLQWRKTISKSSGIVRFTQKQPFYWFLESDH